MPSATFRAFGVPRPQGSPSIVRTKAGRPFVLESKATRSWRALVRAAARVSGAVLAPAGALVVVEMSFFLPRPRTVRRALPVVKPDLDKLVRAVLDAGSGVCYRDDAQVVEIRALKSYASDREPPGVVVAVDWQLP